MSFANVCLAESQNHLTMCLKQVVKEVNNSGLIIYCYTGDENHQPIYYEETILFKRTLESAGLNCPVIDVSDAKFSPLEWNPLNSLLYMPGAIASDLDKHLGSKVEEIKEFVKRKGRFMGWCGSGYWACHKVEYQLSARTILFKNRNLSFWQGTEKGPLLPALDESDGKTDFFHGAVKVKWLGSETFKKYLPEGLEFYTLVSGGGSFIPAEEEHQYKVLAVYKDVEADKTLAIVKTYVANGIAILISPYFTYGAEYMRKGKEEYEKHFPKHNWSKIISDLEGTELKSLLCFADMLLEAVR